MLLHHLFMQVESLRLRFLGLKTGVIFISLCLMFVTLFRLEMDIFVIP